MKKNMKLLGNIASILILCTTLIISVSYGWYTNNKNVSASGIASTASNTISVVSQGVYKAVIGADPYPDGAKDKEVTGLLSGDIIYYSVTVALEPSKSSDVIYDLNITAYDINGGEYFSCPSIKIYENPNGTLTGETYTFEDVEYNVYVDSEGDKYFVKTVDNEEYVYYLYTAITGEILVKSPKKVVPDPNGSATENTFIYNGVPYLTYLDSNKKEYFITQDITTVDGEQHVKASYINYIYEETINSQTHRYNMSDVYTIGIYKIFGTNSDGEYEIINDYSDNVTFNELTKENPLDKEINFLNLLDFKGWDPSVYNEITFTFAIKFDYSYFEGDINVNCVSDKELVFTKIIITETEQEEVGE